LALRIAFFDVVVAQSRDHGGCLIRRPRSTSFARVVKPGGEIVLVNHPGAENGLRRVYERSFAPLVRHLGWRMEFPFARLDAWARRAGYSLLERREVQPLGHFLPDALSQGGELEPISLSRGGRDKPGYDPAGSARRFHISNVGRGAREQPRRRCFVPEHVFAIHPLGYEMAVLMPHHHFRAPPGKTVHFRKRDERCKPPGSCLHRSRDIVFRPGRSANPRPSLTTTYREVEHPAFLIATFFAERAPTIPSPLAREGRVGASVAACLMKRASMQKVRASPAPGVFGLGCLSSGTRSVFPALRRVDWAPLWSGKNEKAIRQGSAYASDVSSGPATVVGPKSHGESNALDLQPGGFTWTDPKQIAASLKRSAENEPSKEDGFLSLGAFDAEFLHQSRGAPISRKRVPSHIDARQERVAQAVRARLSGLLHSTGTRF